jgi:hypothetical protein
MPGLFVGSALLLLVEWMLVETHRALVAVAYYIHFSALGALLISGFWALVTERFDPRAARATIGRITAGASLGGLLGGLLPGRLGDSVSLTGMLPLLAVMQLVAAGLVLLLGAGASRHPDARAPQPAITLRQAFGTSSYLRGLALLIALAATAEGVLDWLFKARATAVAPGGEELLRFFGAFYTVTALLGILLQTTLLRTLLDRLGLARTAALLPAGVSCGALGGLLFPGLAPLLVARGMELVLRNSLFRGAYELLFAPVPAGERRATKLLVDVGAARLGDIAGGGIIQVTLLVAAGWAGGVLLVVTIALCRVSLLVARALHRGYAAALARSLTLRAGELPSGEADAGPASLLQTVGGFDLSQIRMDIAPHAGASAPALQPPASPRDRLTALGSTDASVVDAALREAPLTPALVEPAVRLLAWDRVAPAALAALALVAERELATIRHHLLDAEEDFAIRRRLVRVLADCATEASLALLLDALQDRRFEVRYRAGRVLYRLTGAHPAIGFDREQLAGAILTEVTVGRGVWESRQLLDSSDDDAAMGADLLRDRADRSLEHVFTLLALTLPREPLRLAYHGLHTEDRHLRGTALEYLASVLPERIRERLWPFLEPEGGAPLAPSADGAQAVDRLLQSRESIVLALDAVRQRAAAQDLQ